MLERLERSFEQQVRFTADASHELRTPLAVILTQVELALSRPREATAYRESLEACGRAATRMKSLVDDLLTLARADSGKLELRAEPIDLAQIAEGSVALLEPLAQKRGSAFVRETSPAPLNGRPGTARSSDHQPAEQRDSVHPTRRQGGHLTRCDGELGASSSSKTPAWESPKATSRSCSIGSIGSTPRGRADQAAADWDWRSARASSRPTAVQSQ